MTLKLWGKPPLVLGPSFFRFRDFGYQICRENKQAFFNAIMGALRRDIQTLPKKRARKFELCCCLDSSTSPTTFGNRQDGGDGRSRHHIVSLLVIRMDPVFSVQSAVALIKIRHLNRSLFSWSVVGNSNLIRACDVALVTFVSRNSTAKAVSVFVN